MSRLAGVICGGRAKESDLLDSPLRGKARCREFLRLPTVDVLLNR